jgi:hypothetical protein
LSSRFLVNLNYFLICNFEFKTLEFAIVMTRDQFSIEESGPHNSSCKLIVFLEFLSFNRFDLEVLFGYSLILILFLLPFFDMFISHFISSKFLYFLQESHYFSILTFLAFI